MAVNGAGKTETETEKEKEEEFNFDAVFGEKEEQEQEKKEEKTETNKLENELFKAPIPRSAPMNIRYHSEPMIQSAPLTGMSYRSLSTKPPQNTTSSFDKEELGFGPDKRKKHPYGI